MTHANKVSILLLVFTLSMLTETLLGQNALSDYLQQAGENNPKLQSKMSEYAAALEKIPQAGTLPNPRAAFGYYIFPVETRVGSRIFDFSLSQSFPWFGTLAASKDEHATWALVSFQDIMIEKNNLFYRVKETYYKLWYTDKSIKTYQEYMELLGLQEQLIINQVEAAKSSLVDVLRIQMEQKEITAQREWLIDSRATNEADMNSLLNQSSHAKIIIDDSLKLLVLSTNEMNLMDSMMANNPEIRGLNEQNNAWEKQKLVAKKDGMPSFGIGVNYATISKRNDIDVPRNGQDMLMPMATISIPIYRKKYKALSRELNYRSMSVKQEISNRKKLLAAEFVMAQNQYRDARRKNTLYMELIEQAQETLEILNTAYTVGREDYEEVLRMQQQILKYQLELDLARTNQNISVALLEKLNATGLQ
jgi:outer membrane protein TolC